jgi:small subunit ribosomal protein S6
MLDPDLTEERQGEIVARAQEIVATGGGAWLGHESWGRRKLAYEIDHKSEGSYHLLTFDCEPAALDELTRVLRITDGAMRHMAVRRPKGSPRAPVERAASERESSRAPAEEAAVGDVVATE